MRPILIVLIIAAIAMPIGAVVTILLTPLWRWVESATGLESIGHSGPANWCFVAIYILTVLTAIVVWLRLRLR